MSDWLTEFVTQGGGIVSTSAIIGGFIWRMVVSINKKNDAKAAVIKKDVEERARMLKEDNEQKAKAVQDAIASRATDLKMILDKQNNDLRIDLVNRADLLRDKLELDNKNFKEHYDKENMMLSSKITNLDEILKDMFDELKTRADMTNGNVASIRGDISDLQEDFSQMYRVLYPDESDVRERNLKMRERRKQIEADRKTQEPKSTRLSRMGNR